MSDGQPTGGSPPPALRHPQLGCLREVRRELARLYRRALQRAVAPDGSVSAADASRLAFILNSVRSALEEQEIAERVSLLERLSGLGLLDSTTEESDGVEETPN